MTTMVQCSESARLLIDSRLDTIDRMLLGRMSRQDRLVIVREVEIQIQELLDQRGRDEATREDVLEVLSRLDPPEAFLPEDASAELPSPRVAAVSRTSPARAPRNGRSGQVAGWLGIAAIVVAIAGGASVYPFAVLFESEGMLIVGGLLSITSSVILAALAIALGVHTRREGAWAITGIAAGLIAILTLAVEVPLVYVILTR